MLTAPNEVKRDVRLRLIVLLADPSSKIDAIYAYTRRLITSLSARGDVQVSCINPRKVSAESLRSTRRLPEVGEATMLLQYNPFIYGRWGFAPWLPFKLWSLKRSEDRPKIAVMVHESPFPISGLKSAVIGIWQRLQFLAVRLIADVLFVSISAWTDDLAGKWPRRPVYHLPVASNLPDMRRARVSVRETLGAGRETLVLASFGSGHPSRLMEYVAKTTEAITSAGIRVILLNLGSDSPGVQVNGVPVIAPGYLDDEESARYLAAADIYLAPFVDGVSTRRTTVMAALQHGLPVVGTDGELTDGVLRRATDALSLTPAGDSVAFADAACVLAKDAAERNRRGARARSLYETQFDWPIVSARLLNGLADPKEVE